MDVTKKIAVVYDGKYDSSRVKAATEVLESLGYTVKRYSEEQGRQVIPYIKRYKPALVVTSSMRHKSPMGIMVLDQASKAGCASVMYSVNSGHGMSASDMEAFNEGHMDKGFRHAGFYQYEPSESFDPKAFLRIVQEESERPYAPKKEKPAIDPNRVKESRPKKRGVAE